MNLWGLNGDITRKIKNSGFLNKFIIGLVILCSSCSTYKVSDQSELKYLTLVPDRLSKGRAHIELRDANKISLNSWELFLPQDDRELIGRLNYTKNDRIAIIEEYFSYQGFRQLSDKYYESRIGTTKNKVKIVDEKIPFTIEVEALYAISIMLLDYNVSISPALINTKTGQYSNGNEKEMQEIFSIYKKWFHKMEENEFKQLTWPLAGSKFKWLGRDEVKIEVRSSL